MKGNRLTGNYDSNFWSTDHRIGEKKEDSHKGPSIRALLFIYQAAKSIRGKGNLSSAIQTKGHYSYYPEKNVSYFHCCPYLHWNWFSPAGWIRHSENLEKKGINNVYIAGKVSMGHEDFQNVYRSLGHITCLRRDKGVRGRDSKIWRSWVSQTVGRW